MSEKLLKIGDTVRLIETGQVGNIIGFDNHGDLKVEFKDIDQDYAILRANEVESVDATPAPTDELARLQVENARLRAALAWYAEDMNYLVEKVVYDKHGLPWYAYVAEGDVQERARKALEGGE